VAQPSWEGGPDKISTILPSRLPILLPPGPKGSPERHGPTHSKIHVARGEIQCQKVSSSELEYSILTQNKWATGNQRSRGEKYSYGSQDSLDVEYIFTIK
jgi:hypothetical protein